MDKNSIDLLWTPHAQKELENLAREAAKIVESPIVNQNDDSGLHLCGLRIHLFAEKARRLSGMWPENETILDDVAVARKKVRDARVAVQKLLKKFPVNLPEKVLLDLHLVRLNELDELRTFQSEAEKAEKLLRDRIPPRVPEWERNELLVRSECIASQASINESGLCAEDFENAWGLRQPVNLEEFIGMTLAALYEVEFGKSAAHTMNGPFHRFAKFILKRAGITVGATTIPTYTKNCANIRRTSSWDMFRKICKKSPTDH